MILRPMKMDDLPQVLAIEKASFILPWNEAQFRYELRTNPYSFNFVAVHEEQIIGFINFWILFDQAHLNQIAVHPSFRKNKIGTIMLKDAFERMKQGDAVKVQLEVRIQNTIAIQFYETLGFKTLITKPKYYDNGDDALLMELTL